MKNQGQMTTPNAKSKKSDNKNNISNHLNGIILFQRKFRLYKMIISNMNNTMDSLYNLIYGIMRRITSCFNKDIIPQHKYNRFVQVLLYKKHLNIQYSFLLVEMGALHFYQV